MICQTLNAGILTARRRSILTRKTPSTNKRPLIVLALLSFSFLAGWNCKPTPAPIIVTKVETREVKFPIVVPLKITKRHGHKYIDRQIDLLAAALPARALIPGKEYGK